MSAWPNLQPSRESLYKALRLLTEGTEESLVQARKICGELSESIPQLGAARYCAEYRRNIKSAVCTDRSCGRCGPLRP
ncbi:hypothetical protein ABZX85_41725 [Streptomyces sp. NPDC004539]|uniref:hypothetical protein n=1 Tax=Streptomyces sp. NPDC004539 TaxID=3154280 RepID=UPI00339F0E41